MITYYSKIYINKQPGNQENGIESIPLLLKCALSFCLQTSGNLRLITVIPPRSSVISLGSPAAAARLSALHSLGPSSFLSRSLFNPSLSSRYLMAYTVFSSKSRLRSVAIEGFFGSMCHTSTTLTPLPAWLSTRGLPHFRNLLHPVTEWRLVAVVTVFLGPLSLAAVRAIAD